jgi:hypothetical protein
MSASVLVDTAKSNLIAGGWACPAAAKQKSRANANRIKTNSIG